MTIGVEIAYEFFPTNEQVFEIIDLPFECHQVAMKLSRIAEFFLLILKELKDFLAIFMF